MARSHTDVYTFIINNFLLAHYVPLTQKKRQLHSAQDGQRIAQAEKVYPIN